VNCFFCHGTSGSRLGREHLLSKPICEFFNIDRPTTTLGRIDASGKDSTISSIASLESTAVRLPCENCNNGWMNDLEGRMVSVLDRWMNQDVALDVEGVDVMKRWLAKSHLLLCAIEGGVRGFVDDPTSGVIPDATLARKLFEQADDALELVTTGLGVPRSPRALYGFGNPTPFCSGPAPVSTRVATVSFWNLGGLQIWTGIATLRPKRFRLPGRLVEPRPGLRFGKLRTVDGGPDPTSAEVDYGDLDLPALLAALEPQAKR
jgi:hypothetical protein